VISPTAAEAVRDLKEGLDPQNIFGARNNVLFESRAE
jgi:hypothetical protein